MKEPGKDFIEACPTCGSELKRINVDGSEAIGCEKCKKVIPFHLSKKQPLTSDMKLLKCNSCSHVFRHRIAGEIECPNCGSNNLSYAH